VTQLLAKLAATLKHEASHAELPPSPHRLSQRPAFDPSRAAQRPVGLQVRVCASTAEAVRGADIVTTVTADKTQALARLDAAVA
jgi:Ornithine cyclodeaminase/mu-crystallin family